MLVIADPQAAHGALAGVENLLIPSAVRWTLSYVGGTRSAGASQRSRPLNGVTVAQCQTAWKILR